MKLIIHAVLCGVVAAGVGKVPMSFFSSSRPAKAGHLSEPADDPTPAPEPAPKPVPPPAPEPKPGPDPVPPPEPQLSLPESIQGEIGDFIRIDASTNGKQVHWKSLAPGLKVFPNDTLADPHLTVVSGFIPGDYPLFAYTSNNDVLAESEMVVTLHAPQPPPVPTPPEPVPTPVPPPAASQIPLNTLFVVTIDDVRARTPAVAVVLTDMKLWTGLKNSGVQFEKLNVTNPAVARFAEQIKANMSAAYPTGLPCIVLMDSVKLHANQNGSWLNSHPGEGQLPSTSAGVISLISKFAK